MDIKGNRMDIKELMSFRRMITPIIIQILFWIGVVLCVIAGLVEIGQGAAGQYGGGSLVLKGLLTLLLGPIVVRIYCELLILFFRMNDTLTEIRDNMQKPAPPTLP